MASVTRTRAFAPRQLPQRADPAQPHRRHRPQPHSLDTVGGQAVMGEHRVSTEDTKNTRWDFPSLSFLRPSAPILYLYQMDASFFLRPHPHSLDPVGG